MKRQRENIANQPSKKTDVNVSTDFRSKIGAKLQTLLNGFTPERRSFTRNRRQLYEDLFGEPQHSRIIIDPTIVIKSETPDTEDSSNDATSFNSQNFLLTAKSRINELLNKQQGVSNKHSFQDNEKENSLCNDDCAQTSSYRSNCAHTQTKSHLGSTLSKKRRISGNKDDSSEPTINQVRLKNLVVVVEDIMNSKDGTQLGNLIPTNLESENSSSNLEASSENALPVSEQSMNITAKDQATSNIPDSFVLSDHVECVIEEGSSVIDQSTLEPHVSIDETDCSERNLHFSTSMSKSPIITETSGAVILNDSAAIPTVIPLGDILVQENEVPIPCMNADDSELVDDPSAAQVVLDVRSNSAGKKSRNANQEPDIVLICVKRPTHEVITLEDDDNDSEDVIEEVHECVQCGKAFRAKSLLNFHIRMHGADLSSSPSSSSQSCIA